jgi:DNA-binding CsgD family transcriptional regulator
MVGVFKDKYNVHQVMEVINKTEDGLEAYGFGLNSNDLQQHLGFYNATPLIQLFIDRIKEELNPHKAQLEEYQVDIATLIGPDYHKPPVPLMLEPIQYDSFLKHLNLSPSTPLTSRELQVVKYLLDGYPASHIADCLLLSKRTVEHYIDNIKHKFNCIAKSDLIKILRRLESIGYLENHL